MAKQKTNQTGSQTGVDFRRFLPSDGNIRWLLLITILVFITMSALRPRLFFAPANFSSMAFQFPEFGLLAMAIMLAMLIGGIDLSVVGIANLSGILAALILTRLMPADASAVQTIFFSILAIGVSAVTGLACGLINGFLVAVIGIAPILATLGTMELFSGVAIVITRGAAVFGFPDIINNFGNGSIWIFPIPFLIFALAALVFALILNKTSFGNQLYLMGTNKTAARFSGLNNTKLLLKAYMMSGFLAAVAGFVILARTNSAKADYGASYTLQAILIAVLGGTNPSGGFGKVSGLVLAILTLQFLSSGFSMLRFSNFFKEFIWGAVLLIVMVINYVSYLRKEQRDAMKTGQEGKKGELSSRG